MGRVSTITYLRFVVGRIHENTGVRNGLFNDAYALCRGHDLSSADRAALDALLDWFSDHLSVPERFNRSTSKGSYRRSGRGISWLKPSATEHISRMREISRILQEYGHFVTMIKSARPGYIVYEDEHQIVAEPFADTGA